MVMDFSTTDSKFPWTQYTIDLKKTFELNVASGVCHYFIADVEEGTSRYAAIHSCPNGDGVDEYFGTFFDDDKARYDFKKMKGDADTYRITRAKQSLKSSVKKGHRVLQDRETFDPSDVRDRQLESDIPVLGMYDKPVIELFIGIDESFADYFKNREATIKFVCSVVTSVDAFYQMIGIRVKLVGVRFWQDFNFTLTSHDFDTHYKELQYFIHGGNGYEGVMDYEANEDSDLIPGTPDAVMTMTHRFYWGISLGATPFYNPAIGAYGIMIPIYNTFITDEIHPFPASVTLAHEVGHILYMKHPKTESENNNCYTDEGNCMLANMIDWTLPFFEQNSTEIFHDNLRNKTHFLFEQNCRHADRNETNGSVMKSPSTRVKQVTGMTTGTRTTMWTLLAVMIVTDVIILVTFIRYMRIRQK
jgi:hypothetical protein